VSATGDYPPPEPEPRRAAGVSVRAAVGILVGVLALGLVAVFTIGPGKSADLKPLSAQPGVTTSSQTPGRTPSAAPSTSATTGAGTTTSTTTIPTDIASNTATTGGGDPQSTPAFYVGECVEASGANSSFSAKPASCSSADYKIIYAYQNVSGNYDSDMSRCYTVNGDDSQFENVDASGTYTLYCMNSLTGSYSPRRAGVNNCLDSTASYEVDCTSSRAAWIVIGRLNGTTNTTECSKFGNYNYSYYWSSPPSYVLCVNKYTHSAN